MNGTAPRRAPATAIAALAAAGCLLTIAGVLLVTVRLRHGTIPQWNGLCSSAAGQIGQFVDGSVQHDCGEVSLADHLIGWLFGGGITALAAAALLWMARVVSPVRTGRR